jgi:hypothetical protein
MADTKNENKFDGLRTSPTENIKDIDLAAIKGSTPRPPVPPKGSYLFGTWTD